MANVEHWKKSSQNDIKKFSVFRMKTFHFLKLTHAHIVRFLIQFNVKKFQNRFVSLVCLFVVEKKMNFSLSFQKKFQVFFHYFCVCFDSLSTFVEKKMFTKWKKTMKLRIEKKVKFNDGGIYQQNFFFFFLIISQWKSVVSYRFFSLNSVCVCACAETLQWICRAVVCVQNDKTFSKIEAWIWWWWLFSP